MRETLADGFAPPPPPTTARLRERGGLPFVVPARGTSALSADVQAVLDECRRLIPTSGDWTDVKLVYRNMDPAAQGNVRRMFRRLDQFFLEHPAEFAMDGPRLLVRRLVVATEPPVPRAPSRAPPGNRDFAPPPPPSEGATSSRDGHRIWRPNADTLAAQQHDGVYRSCLALVPPDGRWVELAAVSHGLSEGARAHVQRAYRGLDRYFDSLPATFQLDATRDRVRRTATRPEDAAASGRRIVQNPLRQQLAVGASPPVVKKGP